MITLNISRILRESRAARAAAAVALIGSLSVAGAVSPAAESLVPEANAQSSFSGSSKALSSDTPPSMAELSSGKDFSSQNRGDSAVYDADDPFYIPPAIVPPKSGSVIRTKAAPHLLNTFGPNFPGYAQKILYTSRTQDGTPVAVSGFVIEPTVPWQGKGPTPTVAFAPGTRGQGDACAPSRGVGLTGQVDPATSAIGLNYEIPVYQSAASQGMRVVVTDYIGLGTPGVHTYLNRVEQGQALIDAARAALNVANAPANSPVAFFGYSQGGGAAASAAELAGTYGSELNVAGTYAGAPPADPMSVMKAVDGSSIVGVLGYSINSFIERDPSLAADFDAVLNDKGREFLADSKISCTGDSTFAWGFTKTSKLTKSGQSLHDIVAANPKMLKAVEFNRVGNNQPVKSPIRVANSINDDMIPHAQAAQMARDMCTRGATVQMVSINQPSILKGSAGNHALPILTDAQPAMEYIKDRFNGVPAPNNCGSF